MIKVQVDNGKTKTFDIEKNDLNGFEKQDFQKSIRGIGILYKKIWTVMPMPKRFNRIRFEAKLLYKDGKISAEQILCFADNLLIELTVFRKGMPSMTRINVFKIGKQVFKPKR